MEKISELSSTKKVKRFYVLDYMFGFFGGGGYIAAIERQEGEDE